jgi:trehalose-phosphatase
MTSLPSALDHLAEIAVRLSAGSPAVFLDYDGTLVPIVTDPDQAILSVETRASVERLAARVPVAVVSGRGADDVRARVGLDGVWYAGSHGFELVWPDGWREERGREFLPSLERVERTLRATARRFPGTRVERKPFAIAVHDRRSPDHLVQDIEAAVSADVEGCPELRVLRGKRVLDVQPDVPWNKGEATLRLLDSMVPDASVAVPVYLGDDATDEAAFRAVRTAGVGILVGDGGDLTSAARYGLADPNQVRTFLEALVADVLSAPAVMKSS